MKISPTVLDLISALRFASEQDNPSLVKELAKLPDFEGSRATSGYRLTPEGDIVDGHWWLVMDDDSILDVSDEEPIRCSNKDSRYAHYFPYAGDGGIPLEVLQMADHLRAAKRTAMNKSFTEMVNEVSGAAASSDAARQAPEAMPDFVTDGGMEGVPAEPFDDEMKPEDLQSIMADFTEDFDDEYDENYEPEMFSLQAGTTVYHGTSAEDWDESQEDYDPPFWVTENEYDAQYFVTWNGQEGQGRIAEFQTTRPLNLILFQSRDDMDEFGFHTGIEMGYPREAAEDICARGWDGWIVPHNYQYGGSDIMICTPGALQHVDTELHGEELVMADMTIPEADHPDYMPGGESASDNMEPTFDERSVHANAGWPKP